VCVDDEKEVELREEEPTSQQPAILGESNTAVKYPTHMVVRARKKSLLLRQS